MDNIEIIPCTHFGEWPRWAFLYPGTPEQALARHIELHGYRPDKMWTWGGLCFVDSTPWKVEE